jgi:predicted nucleic acid-binding protein/GNAT superfamily N-acetyltransferase
LRIETIDEQSPYLDAVKALWRSHSNTLGFFPDGAFRDYAHDRRIFIALDELNKCVGYLMFRVGRDRATVVHLCIADDARKQGYSRALVNRLVDETCQLRGILLSCRRDFEASKTWPRLGFHASRERMGRGNPPSELVIWHLDHGHPDLFSESIDEDRVKVVIDTNIFLDLMDESDEESLGLLADWLEPLVSLCYTPELLTDLSRCEDADVRKKRAAQAQQFMPLICSSIALRHAEAQLQGVLPIPNRLQDESDNRHLTKAVASDAHAFVTRDARVLEFADEIYDATGLLVIRPAHLVSHLDAVQREKEYQRKFIAGTRRVVRERISIPDGPLITTIALHGERHKDLTSKLNQYLSDPERCECHKVVDGDDVLAVYVLERDDDLIRIPLLRICGRRKSGTIARAILTAVIRHATQESVKAVLVSDGTLADVVADACDALGFLRVHNGWLKLVVTGLLPLDKVAPSIDYKDPAVEAFRDSISDARNSSIKASQLEHILWPVKIADSPLPCFIIPIRPEFAEQLFDVGLASGSLFGAEVDLALNPESAYYRSAKPAIITCPSRVLWYVSQHRAYAGSQAIRACSRIIELSVDAPKVLYKRFRRLGVYEWSHVLETARGDLDKKIMGFRFDDTELLPPVSWDQFQSILRSNGIRTNLQGPVKIPAKVFGEIYATAFDSSEVR